MPYIKQEDRTFLNERLTPLLMWIESPGELNYVISCLIRAFVTGAGGNYAAHNAAIGVLECVKLEQYRRQTAPYEDTKIVENGDL